MRSSKYGVYGSHETKLRGTEIERVACASRILNRGYSGPPDAIEEARGVVTETTFCFGNEMGEDDPVRRQRGFVF